MAGPFLAFLAVSRFCRQAHGLGPEREEAAAGLGRGRAGVAPGLTGRLTPRGVRHAVGGAEPHAHERVLLQPGIGRHGSFLVRAA